MSRSFILTLIVVMPAVAIVSSCYFMYLLKRFVADTPRIETTTDLDAFKSVVRKQMYAALVQIGLLGIPILLFLIGVFTKTLRAGDFVYMLIPSLVVFIFGKVLRGVERKAQTLPVSTPELEQERDSIVFIWEKRALPGW